MQNLFNADAEYSSQDTANILKLQMHKTFCYNFKKKSTNTFWIKTNKAK
jgi:hypothetical protein